MREKKRIALVAHDAKKAELIDWVKTNASALQQHTMWATGTTAKKIKEVCPKLDLTPLKSGPLGGDQQIGARIAEGQLDILIFFTDALSPHPHDADVRALTRLSTLYNVAMATNRTTADFLVASPVLRHRIPSAHRWRRRRAGHLKPQGPPSLLAIGQAWAGDYQITSRSALTRDGVEAAQWLFPAWLFWVVSSPPVTVVPVVTPVLEVLVPVSAPVMLVAFASIVVSGPLASVPLAAAASLP